MTTNPDIDLRSVALGSLILALVAAAVVVFAQLTTGQDLTCAGAQVPAHAPTISADQLWNVLAKSCR